MKRLSAILISVFFLMNFGSAALARSELIQAIIDDRVEDVQRLLEHGADPNEIVGIGITPLMWPKSRAVAALLVEHGADVFARTDEGDTPLIEATRYGRVEVMDFLLEQGAVVDERNNAGLTALGVAVRANEHEAITFLRSRGASIAPPPAGQVSKQTLFGAAALAVNVDLLRELIAAGWTPSSLSEEWPTLLASVIGQGKSRQGFSLGAADRGAATVRLLLELGADPEARSRKGEPLLHTAVQVGVSEVVAALLEAGADPNSLDSEGQTPLFHAMDMHASLATLLLEAGANPADRNVSLGGFLALSALGFMAILLLWLKGDALFQLEIHFGIPSWGHNLVLSVLLALFFTALVHFAMRVDFWFGGAFHWQIALTMEGLEHYYPRAKFDSLGACLEELAGRRTADAFFPDLLPYEARVTRAVCLASFSLKPTWLAVSVICYGILGLIAALGRRGGDKAALLVLVPSYILVLVLSPYAPWVDRVPQGGLEDVFGWKEILPNAMIALVISIFLVWACSAVTRTRAAAESGNRS